VEVDVDRLVDFAIKSLAHLADACHQIGQHLYVLPAWRICSICFLIYVAKNKTKFLFRKRVWCFDFDFDFVHGPGRSLGCCSGVDGLGAMRIVAKASSPPAAGVVVGDSGGAAAATLDAPQLVAELIWLSFRSQSFGVVVAAAAVEVDDDAPPLLPCLSSASVVRAKAMVRCVSCVSCRVVWGGCRTLGRFLQQKFDPEIGEGLVLGGGVFLLTALATEEEPSPLGLHQPHLFVDRIRHRHHHHHHQQRVQPVDAVLRAIEALRCRDDVVRRVPGSSRPQ
jgi:hypothetical protein